MEIFVGKKQGSQKLHFELSGLVFHNLVFIGFWLCFLQNMYRERRGCEKKRNFAASYCMLDSMFGVFYFRVPCRAGMCTTPIHVTSSQLIASEIFPVAVVKAFLYPGAVANGMVKNMTLPSWDNLFNIYNLTSVKEAPAVTDLQRIEVIFLLLSC